MLDRAELERYDRQIRIRGFGLKGQERLKEACVAIIGLGGLGCPAALYLAAAGVGYLRLVDNGRVELSNLNRQVLYRDGDIGRQKAELAAERLREVNPHIRVKPISAQVDEENVLDVLRGADVVLDGLDNWRTRFIVNRACVELGIPFIHAGVRAFYGQITTIFPGRGPCLRCIIKATPPEEKDIPVIGPVPAIIASIQALEAIKLITGLGRPLIGRMLILDGLEMRFEEVLIERDEKCPVCASRSH